MNYGYRYTLINSPATNDISSFSYKCSDGNISGINTSSNGSFSLNMMYSCT